MTEQETPPSIKSGFEGKGATWKANKLYYFSADTGISFAPDALHPKMFRVVYPDGAPFADMYNLARVKQHCHAIAHALIPIAIRSINFV